MRAKAIAAATLTACALGASASCLVVTPLDELPEASGGRTSAGGASGKAGSGGGGRSGADGCSTHEDCASEGSGRGDPYLCRQEDGTCQRIKSEACPLVYGSGEDDELSSDAIVFGAFATLSPTAPDRNSVVYAHRLALEELSGDNIGGLPPSDSDGARRPLTMVVCNNAAQHVETALAHLVSDLSVKAVLATLKPGDLRRGFERHAKSDVLYLSPVAVTETVAKLKDKDLVWNLLGQPADAVPAYAALVKRLEPLLRKRHGLTADRSLRVALVTTLDAFDSELATKVAEALVFNGKSTQANRAAGNYELFTATSTDAEHLNELATAILQLKPHLVVSAASEVMTLPMTGIVDTLEAGWEPFTLDDPEPQALPSYVLSPYNAGSLESVADTIAGLKEYTDEAEPQQRFVGISFASAEDRSLQFEYETRLGSRFKGAYQDSANYYDAVYFLAYAMHGAGTSEPLSGSSIARGMKRLLTGKTVDVGPKHILNAFQLLSTPDTTIQLSSTLGPPSFDPHSGVRSVNGSVFCFSRDGQLITVETDVLIYDREQATFRHKRDFCFPLPE